MALTNIKIKNLKSKERPYKESDGLGLFMLVNPNGSKLWRFKYRLDGKEKLLSIGKYPDVPLAGKEIDGVFIKGARDIRDEARQLVKAGVDPSKNKKAQKSARINALSNSFEVMSREWFENQKEKYSEGYLKDSIRRFEQNLFPWLGRLPINEIKVPEILESLKRVEDRGANETAHRLLSHISNVFRFAISSGRLDENPAIHIKGALKPVKTTHLSAITEPKKVGSLLRMIDSYHGSLIVKCALKLAPLVFVRSGELRAAKWSDVDFNKAQWRFTASKTNTEHIVPLSRQAIEILNEIKPLTCESEYVFPSPRTLFKPISDNAVLSALRAMGIPKEEMSGHGFRAMARTLLDEELNFKIEYIEQQLAHTVRDSLGRAYNRTTHIKQRTKMMQAWADYLDVLKKDL